MWNPHTYAFSFLCSSIVGDTFMLSAYLVGTRTVQVVWTSGSGLRLKFISVSIQTGILTILCSPCTKTGNVDYVSSPASVRFQSINALYVASEYSKSRRNHSSLRKLCRLSLVRKVNRLQLPCRMPGAPSFHVWFASD